VYKLTDYSHPLQSRQCNLYQQLLPTLKKVLIKITIVISYCKIKKKVLEYKISLEYKSET